MFSNNIQFPETIFQKNKPEENEADFEEKILLYIQQNKPEVTLSELLQEMKMFSPDKAVSLSQLNKALLYSDTTLRKDENFQDYTNQTLNKLTCQLLGVYMIFNNFMNKSIKTSDEETQFD